VNTSEPSMMPRYVEPQVVEAVLGYRDRAVERRQAAAEGFGSGRVGTAVPGVERAPTPVAAHAWGTWNPDGVQAVLGGPVGRP
jgi:hypothetical protein